MSGEVSEPEDFFDFEDEAGLCECKAGPWDACDCGEFFLNWICGYRADGSCSLAGTEDCDWECQRGRRG